MSVENPREFVGSDTPYEELKIRARELAREARELDEQRERAMREGEFKKAKELSGEHERVMEAQRRALSKIAELKKLSLKK